VSGRDIGRLGVRAGQFFNWRFLAGPGWNFSAAAELWRKASLDDLPLIRAAYDILCAMADDGDSLELRDELDLMRAKFDDACDVVGAAAAAEADHLRGERDTINRAYRELGLERNALVHDRDNLLAERDALLASPSWRRLTAPLRWMRSPSKRRR